MRFRIQGLRISWQLKREQSSSPQAGQTTLEDLGPDFDRKSRIRHMQFILDKVQVLAGDDKALESIRPDIRSSLATAEERCRAEDLQQCQLFIRAVAAVARFLGARNALDDRIRWGEVALAVAEMTNDNLAIAELCGSVISWPLLQQGRHEEAGLYCLRGLEAAKRVEDPVTGARWAGSAARTLSGIARDNKDAETAYHWAGQAAMYAKICNEQTLIRGAELDFGYAALLRGDFVEAETRFRKILGWEEQGADLQRIGDRSGDLAIAIVNRAIRSTDSLEKARLLEEAGTLVNRTNDLGKEIGNEVMVAESEIALAVLARTAGEEDEYRRLMESGHRTFGRRGIVRPGRWEQFVEWV